MIEKEAVKPECLTLELLLHGLISWRQLGNQGFIPGVLTGAVTWTLPIPLEDLRYILCVWQRPVLSEKGLASLP